MRSRVEPTIRRMSRVDLDRVVDIESRAYPHPWTRGMLEAELGHDWSTTLLAVDDTGEILGFAIFWTIVDEVHVLDVAVDPDHQRRGVASALLDEMLERTRAGGARVASLEVRSGDLGAQALYRRKGFRRIGERRRYYVEDGEDAIVMERGL